jgi:outer membrane protein assembly complex protein YaeT
MAGEILLEPGNSHNLARIRGLRHRMLGTKLDLVKKPAMTLGAAPGKKGPPKIRQACALLLAWMLLWCLGPTLLVAEEPGEPPPLTLRSLRIEGAQTIKAGKIRKQLNMTLPSRLPFKKRPPFTEEQLEADLEQLRLFYRTQGFYHTRITSEILRRDGQVEVVLHIEEGPWVRVTGIELQGSGGIGMVELERLQEQGPLKPGARYSDERYEELKRNFLSYFQNHGYFWSKLAGKVYLDDVDNTARIVLQITPGPICYFGEARVEGEADTPRYLILRKLAFKKGDLYSLAKIYDSQKNLFDTDLFQSATVMPAEVPPDQTIIPITVTVQEKKKRSVKVGLGYGDEELFRARLALRLRNVGGGGRILDLETKYSSIEGKAVATFTNPQIFASRLDLVASGGWVRRVLPSFVDQSYYTFVRLERNLPWKFRTYLGHAFEYARPFDIPLSTLLLLENTQPGKHYTSSMVIYGLSRDTTVNPIDPTGGGKIIITGEGALDFLGSNLDFYRTIVEVRRYHTLIRDVVISGRLKFGIIQPIQQTSQIPIQRRFFSGGYNSVRGYRLDYLGPRTPSGDPLGGDAVIEGNLETRVPLYKKFRAVGFLDFGNVYFKASDIDLGKLKYAAGFGINYLTPIGPMGLYFAWPLNPINPSVDTFRVHFTLGPSF